MRRATQAVSGLSNGSAMTNDYGYTNDRITSITHNGFTYNFEYDIWGKETAVKVGSQTLAAYTYTADESINTITYGNGDVLSYTYNSDGNVVSIRWNNTAVYTYTYDNDGILTQTEDVETGIYTTYSDDGYAVYLPDDTLLYSVLTNEDGEQVTTVNGVAYTETTDSFVDKSLMQYRQLSFASQPFLSFEISAGA